MQLEELDAILIDGRSGSGKTSLADRLASRLRSVGRTAQILRIEDLYPGWDGLAVGSQTVPEALAAGSYRRYDWIAAEFGDHATLSPGSPLIIEGCGAATADNLAAVQRWVPDGGKVWSVWLSLPGEERRARALARDGETFAPHWDRWAAQEDAHFAEHEPWDLVDEVLRG